jgi:two-component system nitrate/nitrite response regulator NarL
VEKSSVFARVAVLVVEDHPVYRYAIEQIVGNHPNLDLVGSCADGRTAVTLIRARAPDVALVDFDIPLLDGIGVSAAIGGQGSPTRVLLLSAYVDEELVHRALATGVGGYISKDLGAAAICNAILAMARGETVLSEHAQRQIAARIRRQASMPPPSLTDREMSILRLVATGRSTVEISRELHLSRSTVKTHLSHTYQKLGVSDRTAAVAVALRSGLLDGAGTGDVHLPLQGGPSGPAATPA